MAGLKIISYRPQNSTYVKGVAEIEVNGEFTVVVKVLQNKDGHFYCKSSSSKIGDEWLDNFQFCDSDRNKNFLNYCLDTLDTLIKAGTEYAAPLFEVKENPEPKQEDLPF